MTEDWIEKVREYCTKYNIPLLYLTDTLYEPKVIPMIRGMAFEFSVMLALQEILPQKDWEVSKPIMNAQAGLHDVDVKVRNRATNRSIRIECKLAKKEGYQLFSDGHSEIRVKCMRSRTLGEARVKDFAPKWGVSRKVLAVHNDQYLPQNFDLVVCSIGNAFYRTESKTGIFEWHPKPLEESFLLKLAGPKANNLKDFAYHRMYVAKTEDIAIRQNSGVVCTRRGCKNKKNCGFIPNYPIIKFDAKTGRSTNRWVQLEESLIIFNSFVHH